MEQGSNGSGVRFFTLLNGIDDSRCVASFSFDYENINYGNNLIYPDSWNIYSATGILNNTGINKLTQIAQINAISTLNYSASDDFKIITACSSSGINIYKKIESNQWTLAQVLTGEGTGYLAQSYGKSASISKDGQVIVTTSLQLTGENAITSNIWVYTGNLNSLYKLKTQIDVKDISIPFFSITPYSYNITNDNNTIVIVNPQHSGNYYLEGAAYFLTGSINSGWNLSNNIILGDKYGERLGAFGDLYMNNDASAIVLKSYDIDVPPTYIFPLVSYYLYTGTPINGYNKAAVLKQITGYDEKELSAFKFIDDKLIFAEHQNGDITFNSTSITGFINTYTGIFSNIGLEKKIPFNWISLYGSEARRVNYIDDDLSSFFVSYPIDTGGFYGERIFSRYQLNNDGNRYILDNNFGYITGGTYSASSGPDSLLYDENISQILIHNNSITGFQVYEYANPEIKNFYVNSGYATFNGKNLMSFDRNLSLYRTRPNDIIFDTTIFITFEKERRANEILISSMNGTAFANYSGFCLGVNDANKLYFKYWNPVDGQFSYTFPNILANKNSIYLQTQSNSINIGWLNNNTKDYEVSSFPVFRNTFKDSSNLILGGSNTFPEWLGQNVYNFSGKIDNFYIFRNISYLDVKNITSGFIYTPQFFDGNIVGECYQQSFLSGSGFSGMAITGKELVEILTGDYEVTGILTGLSGILSTGITGYESVETNRYIDNCGNEIINYRYDPLTGTIITNVPFRLELTGYVERSGLMEIELSGLVENFIDVEIVTTICNDRLLLSGEILYNTGIKFLSDLSYSEISLISKLDGQDSLESFCENYMHDPMLYNKNLKYDIFNRNHYINEPINITGNDQILLFANGQALIKSGYYVQQEGYDNNIIVELDYGISGNNVLTNKFKESDYLFYDYFTGNFEAYKSTGTINKNSIIFNKKYNEEFIFLNGQKLFYGKDFINKINYSGDYNFIAKQQITGYQKYSFFRGQKMSANSDFSILSIQNPVETLKFATGFVVPPFLVNSGCIGIYTGNKYNGWNLKEIIFSPATGIYEYNFGMYSKFSSDGSVLAITKPRFDISLIDPLPPNRGSDIYGKIFIYTGSKQHNYVLKQTINSLWGAGLYPENDYKIHINTDGSSILFKYDINPPSGITGNFFHYTGSKENGWSLNKQFNQSVTDFVANENHSTIGLIRGIEFFSPSGRDILIHKKNQNNWLLSQILTGGLMLAEYFAGSDMSNDGNTIIINSLSFHWQNYGSGIVYIFKQNNNQYNLDQFIFVPGSSQLYMSQNGNVFFTNTGNYFMFTGSKNNKYALKTGLSSIPGYSHNSAIINKDGSVFLLENFINNWNPSIIDIYTGTAAKNFEYINTLNDISGENYFAIKDYSDDLNRYFSTGITNTNFSINKNTWESKQILVGRDVPPTAGSFGPLFGNSIAISRNNSNVLLMGGYFYNQSRGAVIIYTGNSNIGWSEKQFISGEFGTFLGDTTAISANGDVIAIRSGVFASNKSLSLFTGNQFDGWEVKQRITGIDIGGSIYINDIGSVIITNSGNDNNTGYVPVYTGNSFNGWNLKQILTGNAFVGNVSSNYDQSIIVFGGRTPNQPFRNSVYIYTGSPNNGWVLKQTITGSENGYPFGNSVFGASISINNSGNILFIGEPLTNGNVYIYTGNIINDWNLKYILTGEIGPDLQWTRFGETLDCNNDGSVIIVGFGNPGASLGVSGASFVYKGNINNGWNLSLKLFGEKENGIFGRGVKTNADGSIFMVGSRYYSTGNQNVGASYLFTHPVISENTILKNGTIKISESFNHGCSQLYFNGIRQKINNNYIENSDFDMLSGTFNESELKQNIYTNTDNFFIQV